MKKTFCHQAAAALLALLTMSVGAAAQVQADSISPTDTLRQWVVANIETGVPIRDVLVYTDDGQEAHTAWDGTFAMCESFATATFVHSKFERRVMYGGEAEGDTIWLIPSEGALNEVIIYGQRRDKSKQMNLLMSPVEAQLAQGAPQGFNPLGLLALAYDAIWGKKARNRKAMKEQKRKMILDNY